MTVHMFRVCIGLGLMSSSDLETRINDWIGSNAEWSNDTVAHTLTIQNTMTDDTGSTFHAVDVRFTENDTKSNLLQKLADKLKDKVSWYRVGYHACMHNETDGGACSWDDAVEWTSKDTTIPSGVPDFTIE